MNHNASRELGRLTALRIVLSIAFVGALCGCVFVPTPHYYAEDSRRNLTETSAKTIKPGSDTVESVILKLGEPDSVSTNKPCITYNSQKVIGQLFVFMVDNLPDVDWVQSLEVYFDNNDVVTNTEFSKGLEF